MPEASAPIRRSNVVLLSTYEMGRQPFGLASPAAWLDFEGASVRTQDLSVEDLDQTAISEADLVGFYLPMHTATRLAAPLISKVRHLNKRAHVAAFGLYAPLNEAFLRDLSVDSVIGGEFEQALVDIYRDISRTEGIAVDAGGANHLRFRVPDRTGLPGLEEYARLQAGGGSRIVGYTEATRGCKHLCRHCPVVPIYQGRFHIVQPDVVLADIANQVEMGARHITFGDPDFFNGPAHAIRIIEAMNRRFPSVTYDVTIKVQHLAERLDLIRWLTETGCAFVTTAVESFDDNVLVLLDKGHSAEDFLEVLKEARTVGLPIAPTFVAFSPWTTIESYGAFLGRIRDLELVDAVAPIQYAIRLLVPEGSRMLELEYVRRLIGPFDRSSLVYPWSHVDPAVDELREAVLAEVSHQHGQERRVVFRNVWEVAARYGAVTGDAGISDEAPALATIPYLTEPWYC